MTLRSITNFLTLLLALAGCVVAIVLTYEEYHPKADIGCSKLGGDCAKTIGSRYGHLGPIPTSLLGLGMYLTVAGLCVARHNALRARRRAEVSHAYAEIIQSEETGASPREEDRPEASAEEATPGTLPHRSDAELLDSAPPLSGERPSDPLALRIAALKRLDTGVWAIALSAVVISWWLQNASLYELCSFCPWCFGSATLVTLIFLLTSYDLFLAGRTLEGEQKLLAGVSAFIAICFAFVATPVVIERIHTCGPKGSDIPPPVTVPERELLLQKYLKFKGDSKAKYTLIEFGDYQCSHCQKAVAIVDGLLKSPPEGGVRFAFRNFPLTRHPFAVQAAITAEAAGEQGKFWQMHDLIFHNMDEMDKPAFGRDSFDQWAKSLGLDLKRFNKDSDSPMILDRIKKDQSVGDTTGLTLTPTFYLITPNKVTRFTGTEDIIKMWHNPKSPFWQ